MGLQWWRLKRSLGRRWREMRLPRGFERLGTRYGGWWLFAPAVSSDPLLVDCGLGKDISFPVAFLKRFGGRVIGVDASPDAVRYCRARCPSGMEIREAALWTEAARELTFHLPKPADQLPKGADGISGSLMASHAYAGEDRLVVRTTSLSQILGGQQECDVLKLDIEGAEFEVLGQLCASGEIRRTRQLLVEFHHQRCAERSREDSWRTAAEVEACGFTLRHIEDRNCLFVRRDI